MPHSNDYELELANLSSLKLLNHPNIVQLLGSYTHRQKHNFIFPKAEGGSLAELFKKECPAQLKAHDSWIVSLSRLAAAISEVHELVVTDLSLSKIGCHHDIRPNNILVNKDQFILADFGLTRFKEHDETSATQFRIGQGYCLAPECQDLDDDFQKHPIHRSSDVWSFGCIIADLVTYIYKGPLGIEEFRQNRRKQIGNYIFYYFHHGSIPSPSVGMWLDRLEIISPGPVKMLIALTRRMLEMIPENRPSARETATRLRFIALYTISLQISEQFEILQSREFRQEASIEISTEACRFASWTWSLGVDIERKSEISEFSPQIELEFEDFLRAVGLLQTLRQELESIQAEPMDVHIRLLMPLRRINTGLLKLLSPSAQRRAMEYVERKVLRTQNAEILEKFGQRSSNNHAGVLAKAKSLTLLLKPTLPRGDRTLELHNKPEPGTTQLGHHIIGNLKLLNQQGDIPVLIEYKAYEDPLLRSKIYSRMEGIAALSHAIQEPDKLRVLHCREYYHDEDRSAFGLVYDFPQIISPTGQPVTCTATCLQQILKDQRRDQQPCLGDKLKLAYKLASAISSFQKIGWFHKGISSSAVAFFYEADVPFVSSSMDPYLIGFRHSRPNEVLAFTEGPPLTDFDERAYHHPQYLRNNIPYSFVHECYSLGIVLLEIGLWKPLMKMGKFDEMPNDQVRTRLLDSIVPRLAQSMGIVYMDVVLALLGPKDSEKEDGVNKDQLWFDAVALNELYRLSIMEI